MSQFQSKEVRRCARCILPEDFPGSRLDDDNICAYCRATPSIEELSARRKCEHHKVLALLDEVRGKASYDVILAFSGGKDSSYLLWMLSSQYKLNVLAVTIDNGYLSSSAMENCRRVVDFLNVDHLVFRPASKFMKRLYTESFKGGVHVRSAATRASEICNSCIRLINTEMIRIAVRYQVGIVAGGYIGGQVPKDGSIMRLSLKDMAEAEKHIMGRFTERFGGEAARFLSVGEVCKTSGITDHVISVINPLLTIDYSESSVLDKLGEIGWVRPSDTGTHSSNCRMNDLGIIGHLQNYGFHPYLAELADQVRSGSMGRNEALERIERLPTWSDVKTIADDLGIISPVKAP